MIISNFTGNLGNHMWIYAITRMVAERNGYEWGFNPIPEFDYYSGQPQMKFMNIDYGIQNSYTYHQLPNGYGKWEEKYNHIQYDNGDTVDYHPFQPEIFDLKDNTKLYIRCCQDARYLQDIKDNVQNWFKIKQVHLEGYEEQRKFANIEFDDQTVVLNIRGGEYKGIPNVLLRKNYWLNAIDIMRNRNGNNINFIIITDDTDYAKSLFSWIPAYHFSIGMDYWVLNNAKNLILSNSSFAIFPAWLNNNDPYVIAPRYWARHNVSTGYWASSDIFTFGWDFLDKDGYLYVD